MKAKLPGNSPRRDGEFPLVVGTVVVAALRHKIVQACLATIRPVFDMVRVGEAGVLAPGYVSRHITGFMWRGGLCGATPVYSCFW